MRRLSILLGAILLGLSPVACGTQIAPPQAASPEPMAASASSAPSGDADELMAQVKTLARKTDSLSLELWEGQMFEVVLAPSAAAANPELAKARALLDEMRSNEESIATLLDQVAQLGVSEELTTYAGQQREITELQCLDIARQEDLLKKIELLYREKGKVGEPDLEKLFTEAEPLGPDHPLMRLEEKILASIEYFKQHGLPRRYFINNGFGEAYGLDGEAEAEGFEFPVPVADWIQIEGPTTVDGAPRKIWGSFEMAFEEAVQAQQSLLESEGWSVSLVPSGETHTVMTARKSPYEATLTFEQVDPDKAGKVVIRLTEM